MRIRALVQGILLLASTAAHVAEAQTLYGLEFNGGAGGGAFVELDRIAGSDVSLIGNAAALTAARGMAMDPTTGVLYALQSVGGASSTDLYTLVPSIGAATCVATIFDTGGTAYPPGRGLGRAPFTEMIRRGDVRVELGGNQGDTGLLREGVHEDRKSGG